MQADIDRLGAALVQIAEEQERVLEELTPPPGYAHLPLAVIDSVYSLRSPYSAARAAVSAYREHAHITDPGSATADDAELIEHTIRDFLASVGRHHGEDPARRSFGGARYKAPGTNALKADVAVAAAEALLAANVNVRRDLADHTCLESAKAHWKAVNGLGQQSWSYFTMLAGVEDWKVDTWVHRFVVTAIGRDVGAAEARRLLDATITRLEREGGRPLSKRAIDHAIWRSVSGRPPR